jgi:hypothetical protein
MLLVGVPCPLGVDSGADAAAAQVLIVEVAVGEFREFSSQRRLLQSVIG